MIPSKTHDCAYKLAMHKFCVHGSQMFIPRIICHVRLHFYGDMSSRLHESDLYMYSTCTCTCTVCVRVHSCKSYLSKHYPWMENVQISSIIREEFSYLNYNGIFWRNIKFPPYYKKFTHAS